MATRQRDHVEKANRNQNFPDMVCLTCGVLAGFEEAEKKCVCQQITAEEFFSYRE